jgi:hypothetical protein
VTVSIPAAPFGRISGNGSRNRFEAENRPVRASAREMTREKINEGERINVSRPRDLSRLKKILDPLPKSRFTSREGRFERIIKDKVMKVKHF